MGFDFKDKIFFITGAAGGLGKEFAKRVLQVSGKVAIADKNSILGEQTVSEFGKLYGDKNVCFVEVDVTDEKKFKEAWKTAEKFFDKSKIDVLVNNAGVMGEKEGWRLCMDINLKGVLNGAELAESRLEKNGIILNVSSILGLFNGQQPKGWAYNTSKSAVVTYTRCVGSQSHPNNLRYLCLCPSITQTPILNGCTPQELEEMKNNVGGFMNPDQVADAFMALIRSGPNGSVMAVWKDCPPYYIPDTGMGLFIFFTTFAMTAARVIPHYYQPKGGLQPWPHMAGISLAMLTFSFMMGWFLMPFALGTFWGTLSALFGFLTSLAGLIWIIGSLLLVRVVINMEKRAKAKKERSKVEEILGFVFEYLPELF